VEKYHAALPPPPLPISPLFHMHSH
jgi:hypothetical protein